MKLDPYRVYLILMCESNKLHTYMYESQTNMICFLGLFPKNKTENN